MLISSIYNFIFKRKPDTLNCGIFAWIGSDVKNFNPVLFNILGVYNDNRGGDSCGIYYNGYIVKGIGAYSKYESLVSYKHLHNTIDLGEKPLIIGHCRKASVGLVNELNIQPVLVNNGKNKVSYVQAHNGTLTNHKELAKKYDITPVVNEADSVTLAKIIQKKGFSVLEEYEGTAALVMHFTKEPNVLYAFRGRSNKNYYTADERPLHYWNDPEKGTYISSEKNPLTFISNGSTELKEFKTNTLYKLEGNSVKEIRTINREKEKEKETGKGKQGIIVYNYNSRDYDNDRNTYGSRNIIDVEVEHISKFKSDKLIRWTRGFFYCGASICHGNYMVDRWGWISNEVGTQNMNNLVFSLWIWRGILVCNKKQFDELEAEAKKNNIIEGLELRGFQNFKVFEMLLKQYSVLPFSRIDNAKSGFMVPGAYVGQKDNIQFFNSSFRPLFTAKQLFFKNGDYMYQTDVFKDGVYTLATLLFEHPELKNVGFGVLEDNNVGKIEPSSKVVVEPEGVKCSSSEPEYCEFFGNKDNTCLTCGYNELCPDIVDEDENKKEDNKEQEIYLSNTIASLLHPIVNDLETLVEEIETSGYQIQVKDKLEIITESKNNLKGILS